MVDKYKSYIFISELKTKDMKAANLEVGNEVEVRTENGNVIGIISKYWKCNEINQFAVQFDNCGMPTLALFSRKTGKPYMNKYLKANIL